MQRSVLGLLLLTLSFLSYGQEKEAKIHKGKVLSVDGLNIINGTLPPLTESDTRWSTLPSTGWSGGVGLHYRHNDLFSLESHYIYETQRPQYDRQIFRISLPYKMHTFDVLLGKIFASDRKPAAAKYIKAGIQYHFSENLSYTIDDDQYTVNAMFSPNGMGIIGQLGMMNNVSGNHHIDFGFLFKYNLDPIVVYELQGKPEKNSVISNFYPFYVGAKLTYRFAFMSFKGRDGSNNGSGTVRIGLGEKEEE